MISNQNLLDDEIIKIIEIIYLTGLLFIDSFHNYELICRDIKDENFIVSDQILSYLVIKYPQLKFRFCEMISKVIM